MSNSLRFEWEWLDAPRAAVRSHGRTWCRWVIRGDDYVATRVADLRSGSVRDGVYLPLMPVAEWVLANWDYLLEESAPPNLKTKSARGSSSYRHWFRRHNLLAAREGFPLPDLTITREDEGLFALSMAPDERAQGSAPVRYIEGFERLVSHRVLVAELKRLMSAVVDRLDGCDDTDAVTLRAMWAERNGAEDETLRLRRRAAVMGLDGDDPEEVDDELANFLLRIDAELPSELAREALEVGSSTATLEARVEAISMARRLNRGKGIEGPLGDARALAALSTEEACELPYQVGWSLARNFRHQVLDLTDSVVGRPLDHAIGAKGLLSQHTLELTREDEVFQGWVDAAANDVATCALPTARGARAQRFLKARALGMALLGKRERLITESASRPQRVARAFAAELLAPARAVRERVRGDAIDREALDEIAREFNVSTTLVRRQIENHDIAYIVGE